MAKSRKDEIASIFQPRKRGAKSEQASLPLDQMPPALLKGERCPWCESTDPNHVPWDCPRWQDNVIARRKEDCNVCATSAVVHMHGLIRIQAGKAVDFQ